MTRVYKTGTTLADLRRGGFPLADSEPREPCGTETCARCGHDEAAHAVDIRGLAERGWCAYCFANGRGIRYCSCLRFVSPEEEEGP